VQTDSGRGLTLLNKTGIRCKSKVAQRFMSVNPGVRVSASRVYFTQDFLEDYLAHMQAAYRPAESDGHFLLRALLFLKQSDLGKYKKEKINL